MNTKNIKKIKLFRNLDDLYKVIGKFSLENIGLNINKNTMAFPSKLNKKLLVCFIWFNYESNNYSEVYTIYIGDDGTLGKYTNDVTPEKLKSSMDLFFKNSQMNMKVTIV